MKSKLAAVMMAGCLLLGGTPGHAESLYDGTVIAGQTVSVTAPFGGTVKSIALREGAYLEAGETVAQIKTTRVYAPIDGTVRGLFAQAGDSAEQTVLLIAPVSKYTISASVENAYSSVSTKYVSVGETLYIRCTADGTHLAVGEVTAVDGLSYTVETTMGELYMEEKVNLYRAEAYLSSTRVGSGTVARTAELSVKGTGSLIALYVEDGEEVERGQLLFETVEGTLDALQHTGSTVTAGTGGVIASVNVKAGDSVQKGQVLATLYPRESLQVKISVPEDMLGQVQAGDAVRISFYSDEGQGRVFDGTLCAVDSIPESTQEGESVGVSYSAYVDFEADEHVRLGMTASVTILDGAQGD